MARKSNTSNQTKRDSQAVIAESRRQVAVSAQYHHSGPIPDPHTLRMYDELIPGAANRILVMAEEQAKHRKELERTVIRSGTRDSLLGIISGFLIAVVTILSGVYVIVQGYEWGGTILGSAGLGGLVGVFVYGTRSNRKERERKEQEG